MLKNQPNCNWQKTKLKPMETSKRIADKASTLFMQNGIRCTGMDTIAEGLGMSKKTIYRFYPNKDRLVMMFVGHEIDANADQCKLLYRKADNAIAELFMVMVAIRELFTRLNTALIDELEKNPPDSYRLLKNYQSVFLADLIDRNLARGVDEQLYRDDINRKLLANLLLENFMLTLNSDFLRGGTIEQYFSYLIGGIVSSKGFATVEIYKNEDEILLLTGAMKQTLWNH